MTAVASNAGKDIEYYARELRPPRIGDGYRNLADTARIAGLSHEEYLAAMLSREVAEREAFSAALRIEAAKFSGHKTSEEFNIDHQPAADRSLTAHLSTGVFLKKVKTWSCSALPEPVKTHLAVGFATRAAHAGHRVPFDSATGWAAQLAEAHNRGQLAAELAKLRRYRLLVIDQVGYIPFDQDSVNLFLQLVFSTTRGPH